MLFIRMSVDIPQQPKDFKLSMFLKKFGMDHT